MRAVPLGGLFVIVQPLSDSQHSREPPMARGMSSISALRGEVDGYVPDVDAWRESLAAAKRADRRKLRLEVRFAPA